MTVADMNKFRLIVIPDAAYLMRDTLDRIKKTKAKVLMTGCYAQALDGELIPFGQSRTLDGAKLGYLERPEGSVTVTSDNAITKGLSGLLKRIPVQLSKDEIFRYEAPPKDMKMLLQCGSDPLLSVRGNELFIHGDLFAAECYNPKRVAPDLGGSKDASANEADMWGPYDSTSPGNKFGYALMKNILDYAKVDYRVRDPKSLSVAPFLGDHMEQASISANIVYNNMPQPQTLVVRTPFKPVGYDSKLIDGRYETSVTVAPFSYVPLEPKDSKTWQ